MTVTISAAVEFVEGSGREPDAPRGRREAALTKGEGRDHQAAEAGGGRGRKVVCRAWSVGSGLAEAG
ncbi:MAG: hypothetical protein ABTQ27_05310, partial [Amaricoccus sp.]|uniref:hypothetical protein n=1 Tax=Amaricoccus sp. TaxID=1872485 RepID=UPI003315E014